MEWAEKRRSLRKPTHMPASFSYAAGIWTTSNGDAMTRNLSEHGAQLVPAQPLPVGEVIQLTLRLDAATSVDVDARVVWAEQAGAEHRVGLAFRNLGPEEEYRIQRHLSQISAQNP